MTRPRLRWFGLLLVLALVAAACGDDDAETTTAAPSTTAPAADPIRVALVLPGSANDKGFNQLAFEALALLEDEFGAETAYSEMTPVPEFVKAYEDFASEGYDVVIGQGFEFGEIAAEVAPAFPDTIFLVTNNPATSGPNMQGLQPASETAAYLAGIVAGMASETGKVGGVAGFEFPVIVAQMEAFRLGVLSVNPDAEVTITYMGTFDDVEKGKETARAMISVGVDVVYHISDAAGLGVIQAASEEGVYAIGWGGDQYDVAPDAVITSQIVDQRRLIVEAVRAIVEGNFSGEQVFFGLDSPILGLTEIRVLDAAKAGEIQAAVDAAKAAILDGTLVVPFIPEPQN